MPENVATVALLIRGLWVRVPRGLQLNVRAGAFAGQLLPADLAATGASSHRQRFGLVFSGVVLDPKTAVVLRDHRARAERRAAAIGVQPDSACYVFSGDPDSRAPLDPEGVTQRYKRMAPASALIPL